MRKYCQPDTGESTISIRRRLDDQAWPRVMARLEAGKSLVRPARLTGYYIDEGQGPTGPMLTAARVRKLEREGVLQRIGVDRYALTNVRGNSPQIRGAPE